MHNNGLCIKQSSSFYLEKYPSWPKGLPWKGSRSLIAARGFKSLFLRLHSRDFYCVFLRFFGGHAIMHGLVKWHFAERLYSLSGV